MSDIDLQDQAIQVDTEKGNFKYPENYEFDAASGLIEDTVKDMSDGKAKTGRSDPRRKESSRDGHDDGGEPSKTGRKARPKGPRRLPCDERLRGRVAVAGGDAAGGHRKSPRRWRTCTA